MTLGEVLKALVRPQYRIEAPGSAPQNCSLNMNEIDRVVELSAIAARLAELLTAEERAT